MSSEMTPNQWREIGKLHCQLGLKARPEYSHNKDYMYGYGLEYEKEQRATALAQRYEHETE